MGIGVWTGTFGVIAVGTGVIDGTYGSLSSMLLLATIFGFGQETVTAFIDKRAAGLAAASG